MAYADLYQPALEGEAERDTSLPGAGFGPDSPISRQQPTEDQTDNRLAMGDPSFGNPANTGQTMTDAQAGAMPAPQRDPVPPPRPQGPPQPQGQQQAPQQQPPPVAQPPSGAKPFQHTVQVWNGPQLSQRSFVMQHGTEGEKDAVLGSFDPSGRKPTYISDDSAAQQWRAGEVEKRIDALKQDKSLDDSRRQNAIAEQQRQLNVLDPNQIYRRGGLLSQITPGAAFWAKNSVVNKELGVIGILDSKGTMHIHPIPENKIQAMQHERELHAMEMQKRQADLMQRHQERLEDKQEAREQRSAEIKDKARESLHQKNAKLFEETRKSLTKKDPKTGEPIPPSDEEAYKAAIKRRHQHLAFSPDSYTDEELRHIRDEFWLSEHSDYAKEANTILERRAQMQHKKSPQPPGAMAPAETTGPKAPMESAADFTKRHAAKQEQKGDATPQLPKYLGSTPTEKLQEMETWYRSKGQAALADQVKRVIEGRKGGVPTQPAAASKGLLENAKGWYTGELFNDLGKGLQGVQ